jgi:hypothetical protein
MEAQCPNLTSVREIAIHQSIESRSSLPASCFARFTLAKKGVDQ